MSVKENELVAEIIGQTAMYLIPDAKQGDTVSVEAYCSISDKLKKEIKIQAQ